MQKQKQKRMIKSILIEAAKSDVVLPWTRVAKRAALTAPLKTMRA